jgi:response regulator RpfG family c-di-GMP phosphodiesterase
MSDRIEQPKARILVVDDENEIVAFIREMLLIQGYLVEGISDSRKALDVVHQFRPDVCVLDFRMPHFAGSALLDAIKKEDSTTEVIFLTGENETSLAVEMMKRGALDYLLKPVALEQLSLAVTRALEHRRLVLENKAHNEHLERLVAEKTQALNDALRSLTHVHSATLDALSMALDFRDQSTSGHSRRVADLTSGAAAAFGMNGVALMQIEHGALLHDVGKLKIPDSILWKPARLDESEWTTMRKHPGYGFEFLCGIEFLKDAAELVHAHHEKFDGSGYPRGISGKAIPFGARIFAIIDAVDAMIYKRPYNTPITFQSAAKEVRRCAGTHFDPDLVEGTLAYLEKHLPLEILNIS